MCGTLMGLPGTKFSPSLRTSRCKVLRKQIRNWGTFLGLRNGIGLDPGPENPESSLVKSGPPKLLGGRINYGTPKGQVGR